MMNIDSELFSIISKRSLGRFTDIELQKDEKLLADSVQMPPRELLHVYFDIEKAFNIKIPQEAIINVRFDTYSHIREIIDEILGDSKK